MAEAKHPSRWTKANLVTGNPVARSCTKFLKADNVTSCSHLNIQPHTQNVSLSSLVLANLCLIFYNPPNWQQKDGYFQQERPQFLLQVWRTIGRNLWLNSVCHNETVHEKRLACCFKRLSFFSEQISHSVQLGHWNTHLTEVLVLQLCLL